MATKKTSSAGLPPMPSANATAKQWNANTKAVNKIATKRAAELRAKEAAKAAKKRNLEARRKAAKAGKKVSRKK